MTILETLAVLEAGSIESNYSLKSLTAAFC